MEDKRAGKRYVEKGTTAGAHPAIARTGSHGCKKGIEGPKRGVSQVGKGIKEESEASREAKRSAGPLTVTSSKVR